MGGLPVLVGLLPEEDSASTALRSPPPCPSLTRGEGTKEREAERVEGPRGMNGACCASPNPRVPGVPAGVSDGGAGGLPDLPRDGRGRGVVSLGFEVRGMGGIWRVEWETQWARLHRSLGEVWGGVETADIREQPV